MADDRAPEAKPETPAPKPQRDLRQDITDRLVQSLDQGRIPWDRPWQNLEHGLPRNMATGREYRGGNRFMLMMNQLDNAYADPRFGTVKQINELGGRVKKGEHGHPVELWKEQPFWERKDISVTLNGMRVKVFGAARDGSVQIGMPTDQASTLNVKTSDLHIVQHKNGEKLGLDWKQARALDSVVGQTFTVFNAEQCTGLKIEPLPKPEQKFDPVQRGEQIKTAMERDGLTFAEHPKFAFYSPKRDEVSLPPPGQFNDEKGYYGTLLHEIGHATGAEKRLNREGITGGHRFGSEGYAKEELRAEMFSMMMAAETGIPHDAQQHTAYVQSWGKVLKQDKNEIFRAAAEAGKAVDYVLDKEQSLQVMQERQASAKEASLAAAHGAPVPTLREALEGDGWKFKPNTHSYEKTFLLTKDANKGGEFTHGKPVAEKILTAKTAAQGLVIEHGWDDVPVSSTVGATPRESARLLDAAAKELLAREHAHLGVTAVRGQNEPAQQVNPAADSERQRLAAAIQREDALLSAQPHELTFDEFSTVVSVKKLGPDHGRQWEVFNGRDSLGFADGATEEGALRQVHQREVNNALYGNQPDSPAELRKSMPPPQVLAEYPDLQKRWAGVIDAAAPSVAASQSAPDQGKLKAVEIDAPAAWGSALVNRDESGLGVSEAASVRVWVAKQGIGWPVSMSEASFMGRHEGLLAEMATYTFLVPEKDIGLNASANRTTPANARADSETQKPSAYETAIQNFVKRGGTEKDARSILDSELAGDYDLKHLPVPLVFHGFAKPVEAEKLAAAIIAEENRKVLDKEDRKSSEFHMAKQAEEAVGNTKPHAPGRAAETAPPEQPDDKVERPVRPRLRQASRKATLER